MANIDNIEKLKSMVIENKNNLPYINLTNNNTYAGWVKDFHIYSKENGDTISLDLHNESDMFCLFVMASCWSKSGQWENGACFAIYLKAMHYDNPKLWTSPAFIEQEIKARKNSAKLISKNYIIPERPLNAPKRKKIFFRSDFYKSANILADNWSYIKESLIKSEQLNDYRIFANYLAKIEGLGSGTKTMKNKVPLILRELRIQEVYSNIPGEYCCTPDIRVKATAKKTSIDIKLKSGTDLISILKSSTIIYQYFGDLYDIPLFAYEDLL